MKRLKKSKRVSWASDARLCQVRLFLLEDCPSKVGVNAQDHLQAKTSLISDASYVGYGTHSSGFDVKHYVNPLNEKLSRIPQIKWKCPPQFVLENNWCVAAGEESEEVDAQKHREMRVLESVYPRLSSIPPSPSVSLDVEGLDHDDSYIPLIPITPIEEEEEDAADLNASINLQPLAMTQGMLISGNSNAGQCNFPDPLNPSSDEKPKSETQADVAVAAATALTVMLKSKEEGNLIDTDLLIKLFSDPKVIEKLISEYNNAPTSTESDPIFRSKPVSPSVRSPFANSRVINPFVPLPNSNSEVFKPSVAAPNSNPEVFKPFVPSPNSNPEVIKLSAPLPNLYPEVIKPAIPSTNSKPEVIKLSVPLPISNPVVIKPSVPRLNSNPGMTIKKSINEQRLPVNTGVVRVAGSRTVAPFTPIHNAKPDDVLKNKKLINEYGAPIPNLHHLPNLVQPCLPVKPLSPDVGQTPSLFATTVPPVKDVNYYKSLIKQHGDTQETNYNVMQDGKRTHRFEDPKQVQNLIQRPCMYFNSSRGCRNGSNCPYMHEYSNMSRPGSVLEAPNAKKMKLNWEITGR